MRPAVRVPERGESAVEAGLWRHLAQSHEFWGLVKSGIVGVTHRSDGGGIVLRGGPYIGRARIRDVDLDLVEKVPNGLRGLLGDVPTGAAELPLGSSVTETGGVLIGELAVQFVQEARRYAGGGLVFAYRRSLGQGAFLAGKLSVRHTARLRAAGRPELFGYEQNLVTRDVPLNRVVRAALARVESLGALAEVPTEVIVAARGLALMMPPAVVESNAVYPLMVRQILEDPQSREHHDLVRLAAVLLDESGFSLRERQGGTAPRAWFVSLERVFEDAVRARLARHVPQGWRLGMNSDSSVFARPTDAFRVRPDIVVSRSGRAVITADVKYKKWPGDSAGALHSDLYQLLIHARAMETDHAALVFPHDARAVRRLEGSVTNADVVLIGLDLSDLDGSIAWMADLLLSEVDRGERRAARQHDAAAAEIQEREADAVQRATVRVMGRMIATANPRHVEMAEDLAKGLMGEHWETLDQTQRTMLRTAIYFGYHGSELGLDHSGPVLGLSAACEDVAQKRLVGGMGSAARRVFDRATFGQMAAAFAFASRRGDARACAADDWLRGVPAKRGAITSCAVDMLRLNKIRVAAAHTELLDEDAFAATMAMTLQAGERGRLLQRLVAVGAHRKG